jgi:hypothetical protein
MALQTTINRRKPKDDDNDNDDHHHEFDEEINETEDDLIENYRFLTQHCGVLRQSPTTGLINTLQQKQQTNQSLFLRHYASISESHPHDINTTTNNEYKRSLSPSPNKQRCSPFNDLNNNNQNYSTITSRIPPTIYYDDTEDDAYRFNQSFSLVKLFARMKTRLKHDKRYRPKTTHEILCEADPQEWYELTKNVRTVLTKALLPDGGYDALINRSKMQRSRQSLYKKSRDYDPVLSKDNDDDDKIDVDIDEELNTEGDEAYDEIIWKKFLTCPRGFNYRRCAVCKAVDRQQFQGQLVYFYGVANNILIDENLKASGLG